MTNGFLSKPNLCGNNSSFHLLLGFVTQIFPPEETFMGIDWGGRNESNDRGAFTVVTIISKSRGMYKVEFAAKITYNDHIRQVNYIKDLIKLI